MERLKVLCCLTILFGITFTSFIDDIKEIETSYYFIATPRILRAGETSSVSISITELQTDATIIIELKDSKDKTLRKTATTIVAQGNGKSLIENIKFTTPVYLKNQAKLQIKASGGITFDKTFNLEVQSPSNNVFIQTDKPIYKPGGKVQIRVVAVNKQLKPIDNEVIDEIFIKNPSDSRVMQWTNKTLEKGLISLEMPLSKHPVLGDWKISVDFKDQITTQKIKVDKYVLPKYEVMIEPPPFVVKSMRTVPVKICAKYTYGKAVVGKAKTKICFASTSSYVRRKLGAEKNCQENTLKIDGCTNVLFEIKTDDLRDRFYYYSDIRLSINASVTEDATGVTLNSTALTTPFQKTDLKIKVDLPKYYKPGFVFDVKVRVLTPDDRPYENKKVKIVLSHDYKTLSEQEVLIENGEYTFQVSTDLKSNRYEVEASAEMKPMLMDDIKGKRLPYYNSRHRNKVSDSASINPWYSTSNTFIKMLSVQHLKDFQKAMVSLSIKSGEDRIITKTDLNFVVVCNGRVKIVDKKQITSAYYTYSFPITKDMAPSCRLLVYFIKDDGEFVGDYQTLNIGYDFNNKASLSFSKKTAKPGDDIQLTMKASRDSIFALSAVDRSVQLLGETNDLKKEQIMETLEKLDVGPSSKRKKREKCPKESHSRRGWGWGGYLPDEQKVDGRKAVKETGLLYFTNADIDLLPCQRWIYPIMEMAEARGGRVDDRFSASVPGPAGPRPNIRRKGNTVPPNTQKTTTVKTRTEFPETWLWQTIKINELTGEETLKIKVPDTITTWYANGYALSPSVGIGVATPASVKAFQPFFISLTLPYSVKRGETVKIPATVFNYLGDCLVINLKMKESRDFHIVGESQKKLCVCGGKSNTFKFKIKPMILGRIDISVFAHTTNNDKNICQTNHIVIENTVAADALTKKLLVEPEGIKKDFATSLFFCPNHYPEKEFKETLQLGIPKKVVDGSVYAKLSIVGDLMGPSIDGLDKLLTMPYGCGEQNMLKFAPNIYVMDYLTATDQVTEKIKTKAEGFMRSGYQRELTYKRNDGSYSAFGQRDKEGSTWLTAFVLRVYAQAQRYIFIDGKDIEDSKKWLLSLQDSNTGCFKEMGMVHHKEMKGGITSGITMTSFVLNALLEAGMDHEDPQVKKAVKCITQGIEKVNDPYTASVIAYSLSLAGDEKKTVLLNKLNDMAIKSDENIHWEANKNSPTKKPAATWHWSSKPNPANIEMTAYALMSYIMGAKPYGSRLDHFKIVKWLIKQRNSYGGFGSTQDTCVALQALSQYTAGSFDGSYDLDITASNVGKNLQERFTVTDDNKLLVQKVEIPTAPMDIEIEATGNGCAVVQGTVKYNIPDETDEPTFNLYRDIKQDETSLSCRHLMKVCGSFDGPDSSNMALIDVTMVSGFNPVLEELDMKLQMNTAEFSFYEFDNGVLTFYFEKFGKSSQCIEFNIEQMAEVENRKPAPIKLYDYYDTDNTATKMYNVGKCPEINVVV